MTSIEQLLERKLKDPDFRANWERTTLASAVANQVIRYRSDHGLSQSALARQLGVSQAVVGRLELGEHEPKIATLSKLAKTLGLHFTIDIRPETANGDDDTSTDATVERVAVNGVELIVTAG